MALFKKKAPCWGFYESLFSEHGSTGVRNFRVFQTYAKAFRFAQEITVGWTHPIHEDIMGHLPADFIDGAHRVIGHLFPIEYGTGLRIYIQQLPDRTEAENGTITQTDSTEEPEGSE